MALGAEAGIGSIEVDATADRRNIWWAFIRHPVTPRIDVAALASNGLELRVDARVRTDTAPRREETSGKYIIDVHSGASGKDANGKPFADY